MDMQEVLSKVITSTNEIFEAEAGSVALLEPSGQELVIRAAVGAGADAVRGLCLPISKGVIGWVATYESPALIPDVTQDKRFYQEVDKESGFHTKSIICVPLRVDGHTIGVIELMNMRPDYLSDYGVKVLTVIADHAALSIENARLYDEMTRRLAEAKVLQEVMVAAASTLDFNRVLTGTIEALHRTLGIERLGFFLPAGTEVISHPATIGFAEDGGDIHIPMEGSAIGWVVQSGKPLLLPDVKKAKHYYNLVPDTQSEMCVPVLLNKKVAAVLNAESPRINAFDEEDLQLFNAIAAELAVALENARLFEEIRAAEANYHDLFDNANDFIFTIDANFKISSANKAVLQATGYRLNEIAGMSVTHFFSPEQRAKLFKTLKRRLASTKAPTTFEIPVRGKGNREAILEITIRVQRAGRRPVSIHCIARDITRRKTLEQQLRQTEKLSTIGKLVAGVAHELNNPLTSIIGFASLLQDSDLPQVYQEDLAIIFRQAERARLIVRDLLAFASKIDLETAPVDINEVIQASLTLMKTQLQAHNIQVTTSLDFGLPITVADAHQLEQVFVNLITNAVQALASTAAPRKLTIKSKGLADAILLTFADNGPGIGDDIINRIFDPFFSTKEVGEGTGLGLSICYGIISEHKGRIWTENSTGEGAVFYISLPLVTPDKSFIKSDVEPAKVATAIPHRSPLKILAVDDELPLLNLLKRVLEKQGHQVDTAPNGGFAQQKINTQCYDLIICDVLMPDMLGPELYKQAIEDWPDLANRFIFITGNVVDVDTRIFLEKSGLPWLPKPFLPTDIERAIGQALSKQKIPM